MPSRPVAVPDVASLGGALRLAPGTAEPIQGGRPVLSARALHVLTHGVPAEAYAERMALLFGLCGTAHRITAARATRAASQRRPGALEPAPQDAAEDELLALWTAREHLQRLALDLPRRVPVADAPADAAWLSGHPLAALPADAARAAGPALEAARVALRPWLEARVLGGPADAWWRAWADDAAAGPARPAPAHGALFAWAEGRAQPAQRWLRGAAAAGGHPLPCRPVPPAQCEPAALHRLAQRLLDDPAFAQRPTWENEPSETGCWTRIARPVQQPHAHNAFMRWQYRIAELVALSGDGWRRVLSSGALSLGDGIGLAWAEMSRGLLVHVVRLRATAPGATVDQGRVLAPTEWNFHPAGGLARLLAEPACEAAAAQAAVAALDPCVEATFLPPPVPAHA